MSTCWLAMKQWNWYTMKPGTDFPICDIAIGKHAPFQNDILNFSRCARKYCYSLWNVAPLEEYDYADNPGVLSDPSINPNRTYNEPNGRLFGFNVHYNILYDAGTNPEVKYDKQVTELHGGTKEEIYSKVFLNPEDWKRAPEPIRREIERCISKTESGYIYRRVHRVSILGWDPGDISFT